MYKRLIGMMGGTAEAEGLSADLIASWELNEASGNAIDSHGSNDLTDTNTVGVSGGWRDFESSSTEYFTISDNADLSMGDIDFTFEIWVNIESTGADRAILSKWNSGASSREYSLIYNNSTNRFQFFISTTGGNNLSVTASSFGAPSTATPYQIFIWHDSTSNVFGIRVNNGTANTEANSSGVFSGSANFQIGAENGGLPFDGLMRRARLWKRLLTSDERTFLYNGGSGRDYSEL